MDFKPNENVEEDALALDEIAGEMTEEERKPWPSEKPRLKPSWHRLDKKNWTKLKRTLLAILKRRRRKRRSCSSFFIISLKRATRICGVESRSVVKPFGSLSWNLLLRNINFCCKGTFNFDRLRIK